MIKSLAVLGLVAGFSFACKTGQQSNVASAGNTSTDNVRTPAGTAAPLSPVYKCVSSVEDKDPHPIYIAIQGGKILRIVGGGQFSPVKASDLGAEVGKGLCKPIVDDGTTLYYTAVGSRGGAYTITSKTLGIRALSSLNGNSFTITEGVYDENAFETCSIEERFCKPNTADSIDWDHS